MKLHQLRYLAAVAQTGLNITAAAEKLHTSQPGVSKQIKLLEDELGFQIFVRDGRNLSRVTPEGQQVIDRAIRILREVQNIKRLSDDLKQQDRGSLSIATTHTQARYVLPDVIKAVYASISGLDAPAAVAGAPKPAVAVKKSVTPEYIVCLEDGKKLKMLKRHLRSTYNMTPDEYRHRWGLGPDYPMVAPNYAEQRSEFAKKIGLGKKPGARRGRPPKKA